MSLRQEAASEVSRGIGGIYANLYGRGPDVVSTYVEDDYVLSILEDGFTLAERTLMNAGDHQQVHDTRRAFQEAVREEFISVVEDATGRSVRAFMSQVDAVTETAIELFLLDPVADRASSLDGSGPLKS